MSISAVVEGRVLAGPDPCRKIIFSLTLFFVNIYNFNKNN
jgi:hypothetical protein